MKGGEKNMRKVFAMGAAAAMLLATAAPVMAATMVFDNNVSAKANSGMNLQSGMYSGALTQSMAAGQAGAFGTQGINVADTQGLFSTTMVLGNDVKAKANSGLNKQTLSSVVGTAYQGMSSGQAGAQGTQSITSMTPGLFSMTTISGNDVGAKANSGMSMQDAKMVLGGVTQSMTTGWAEGQSTQWIVSNVHQ